METVVEVFSVFAAIATVVVAAMAVVTIREMHEERREAAKPVLFASGPEQLNAESEHIVTLLENIGNGPAFNITIELTHPKLESGVQQLARLDAGNHATLQLTYPQFAKPQRITSLPCSELHGPGILRVCYWDIYGRRWELRTSVKLLFQTVGWIDVERHLRGNPGDLPWVIQLEGFDHPKLVQTRNLWSRLTRRVN